MMDVIIAWMFEHWLIEAIVMILLSFTIGIILGKAISVVNDDN
jgi:hypothetical protein